MGVPPDYLNKYRSPYRRIALIKNDKPFCVYVNMLAAYQNVGVSMGRIKYLCNRNLEHNGYTYWWADEFENKENELLPGAMIEL